MKMSQRFSILADRIETGSVRLMPAAAPGSSRDSIHRHLLTGGLIVLLLAFGVGGWAATTQIAGALIAQGSIVVDSNVKKVQHPTGGVVGKLNVQDGDRVKAGDILVQLDDTITRANLAIVTKGLDELAARKARLEAERDGAETIKFPPELLARANEASCRRRRRQRTQAVRASPLGPPRPESAAETAYYAAAGRNPGPHRPAGCEGARDSADRQGT